jgi:hypothetical protein
MTLDRPDSGTAHHDRIVSTLASLRALARLRLGTEALVHVIAVSCLSLLVGTALFVFVPAEPWLRGSIFALWVLGSAALVVFRSVAFFRRFQSLDEVGKAVEASIPAFRGDVTASLQFGRELDALKEAGEVSVVMVERLLAQTHRGFEERASDMPAAVPRARLQAPLAVTCVAAVVLAIFGVARPELALHGLSGLFLGDMPAAALSGNLVRHVPVVADITLHFKFPEYTDLPSRTIHNSTGDIEVLAGTGVTFEALAIRPVTHAELVLETGGDGAAPTKDGKTTNEATRITLERRPGNRLVAKFNPTVGGTYSILAELASGGEITDGLRRALIVHPDEPPTIHVLAPEAEVEVAPEDVVTFEFEASDDYGLTEVAIVTTFGGNEKDKTRKTIEAFDAAAEALPGDALQDTAIAGATRGHNGKYELDLAPLKLAPKDWLAVVLEAVDNDSVSGPKVATSEVIMLRVSSPEDKHLEIVAAEEEFVEALIALLADYLESPIGEHKTATDERVEEVLPEDWDNDQMIKGAQRAKPPFEAAARIISSMGALLERMEQDPLMLKRDFDLFVTTQNNLQAKHADEQARLEPVERQVKAGAVNRSALLQLLSARRASVVAAEQAILRLEDLVAAQRMENALDTAKDLDEAKERLKELLEKYKETKDPELKAEILREIQRLRQRMMELMAKLQSQIKELPQEHVNLEALETDKMMSDVKDLGDALSKLQEMLEKDDIDGAMAALDELGKNIDDMLAGMEKEFDEAQPEGLSELDKAVSEIMDEVNDMAAAEEEIAKETDEVAKKVEERTQEELKQVLDEFIKQEQDKVAEIKKSLEEIDPKELLEKDLEALDEAKSRVERLQQALESSDVFEALGEATALVQDLQQTADRLASRGQFLPRQDPRKQTYDKAGKGLQKAGGPAREVADDLAKLLEKARRGPNPDEQAQLDKLGEDQNGVQQRLEGMKKKVQGMGGEFPMLKESLEPGLDEAGQYMEGAKQRLSEGKGRRAHDNEKLALEQLDKLKQSMRESVGKNKRMGQDGRNQFSEEDVEIPAEDKRAPKEFREDIMDAMKESGLDDYSSELDEYYKAIVQ